MLSKAFIAVAILLLGVVIVLNLDEKFGANSKKIKILLEERGRSVNWHDLPTGEYQIKGIIRNINRNTPFLDEAIVVKLDSANEVYFVNHIPPEYLQIGRILGLADLKK